MALTSPLPLTPRPSTLSQAIRNLLDLLSSLGINITLEEVLGGLLKLADNPGSLNGATDSPVVRLILQILVS